MRQKTLPTFYYLDHFKEFLQFFEGDNYFLLSPDAKAFIERFMQASDNVQALIVRIANRKHPIIAVKTLRYSEIPNIEELITTLMAWGWLADLSTASVDELSQALTKQELYSLIVELGSPPPKKTLSKGELQDWFIDHCPKPPNQTFGNLPYVYRQFDHTIKFLLFLYFGHLRGRLNQFSMRDLGVMRTRADAVTGEAIFDSAEDAMSAFTLSLQRVNLRERGLTHPPELLGLNGVSSPEGKRIKDKWLYEVGIYFLATERQWALNTLALSNSDNAKEKWLRESYKDGRLEDVKHHLLAIIDSSASENLLFFAEDFYLRKYKQKRTSKLTDMLRQSTKKLNIDSRYNQQVEQGVITYYSKQGLLALRTENQLWKSLFGLTFWAVLFEQDNANLSNEFDRLPPVLKHNQFYTLHKTAIKALLNAQTSKDKLFHLLGQHATRHYGKSNGIFMWRRHLLEHLKVLLDFSPMSSIIHHLRAMCQNYESLCDGYPDIMVIEKDVLRFEEIKAPGDKLRRNQLVTIQALSQAGFQVNVTQVEWYRDPKQIYAVVDIETTGGQSEYHRITEVGIVKIRNNEIIDSWQSLINPQRHIPASITRLTGIDNTMVVEAPLFCEVADHIDEFTADAIFVAHNVNFDLGFIKQEFARLDRYYRRPKLCTVQQMRRVFPGLKSYSLANLTAHFDIEMDRHHRALSDAKAASELLKLVLENEE